MIRLSMMSDTFGSAKDQQLCQTFYNNISPENDPQVYRKECCLLPNTYPRGFNGLHAPVVEFKKDYYVWKNHKGSWLIDQSAVLYGDRR